MTSPARVAADVAALLAPDDPLGQLARRRLALAAQEQQMAIDSRTVEPVHYNRSDGPYDQPEPPTQVGAPLQDAAVNPAAGGLLPPTNAGQADPHGPLVAAYEVGSRQRQQAIAAARAAERPAADADLAAWRAYALSQGADPAWANVQTVTHLKAVFG